MRVTVSWGNGSVDVYDTGYAQGGEEDGPFARARLVPTDTGLKLMSNADGWESMPIKGVMGGATVDECLAKTFAKACSARSGTPSPHGERVLYGDVPWKLAVDGQTVWKWPCVTEEDGTFVLMTPSSIRVAAGLDEKAAKSWIDPHTPEKANSNDEEILEEAEELQQVETEPAQGEDEGEPDFDLGEPTTDEPDFDLGEPTTDEPDFGEGNDLVEMPVIFG